MTQRESQIARLFPDHCSYPRLLEQANSLRMFAKHSETDQKGEQVNSVTCEEHVSVFGLAALELSLRNCKSLRD